ncbi:MAG: DUF5680 domain-containing protein [Candidatus Buchananbacteria bacterium]|nr:DUF5680 domain-containing protein [Candidatus Buchananbacteria bacterium]
MDKITTKELTDFLDKANKNTYANKDAPKVLSTRLKSEDYHFEKGDLIYHDTYFGSRDFLGEEVVYKNNEPVWGMNYYGHILLAVTDEKELYDFLREALMQENSDILPVRGAKSYQKNDWEYKNAVNGKLNQFTGAEEIYRTGVLLYRAYYHGGFIE